MTIDVDRPALAALSRLATLAAWARSRPGGAAHEARIDTALGRAIASALRAGATEPEVTAVVDQATLDGQALAATPEGCRRAARMMLRDIGFRGEVTS